MQKEVNEKNAGLSEDALLLKDTTLLFVDDEPMIMQTFTRALKYRMKEVYTASDGKSAWEAYLQYRPDIVVTDIMMPSISGLELAQMIKKDDPDVEVIIASAYDEKDFFIEAIRAGVNEYIAKPVDQELLIQILVKAAKERRLHKEFQQTTKQRNLILNTASEGIFGLDCEGKHTFVNPSAAEMLGYNPGELIGRNSHTCWHHSRADGSHFDGDECPIYKTLKTGTSIAVEEDTFWRKDGSSFIVDYAATPIFDHEKIVGAVVSFWDTTQRKEREDSLKMFSLAVEQSSSAIMITDTKGDIVYVNERLSEITGYGKPEFLGQNPRILKSDRNDPVIYQEMWKKITSGEKWIGEVINRKKDGSHYWMQLSIYPLISANGEVIRFVSIGEDITEKKYFEEKLKNINIDLEYRIKKEIEKNREKDRMIFEQSKISAMGEVIKDIAHHWRQPLTAIGMLVSNIRDSYEHDELSREYLAEATEKTMEQLQYMSKTIDNFRNFFRPEDEKKMFELEKTIKDSVYMVQAQLNGYGIKTTYDNQVGPTEVMGYPNEFKQVVLNLIKNSMDAINVQKSQSTKQIDGVIKITLRLMDDSYHLSFEDNGGGIDPAIIDKVFDPYFTTKEQGKGVGIGLYMSKVLVERGMGGKITVQNTKEGALLEIVMPRA